jgi:hypothetical protein
MYYGNCQSKCRDCEAQYASILTRIIYAIVVRAAALAAKRGYMSTRDPGPVENTRQKDGSVDNDSPLFIPFLTPAPQCLT